MAAARFAETPLIFSVRQTRFLPLSVTWCKPDRQEAINILGQVFKVLSVCVRNTNTCKFKHTKKT